MITTPPHCRITTGLGTTQHHINTMTTTDSASLQQQIEGAVQEFLANVDDDVAFHASQLIDQLAELAELNGQDCSVLDLAAATFEASESEDAE